MAKISGVKENSIAEELEIVEGDELVSIDGIELKDSIDYNFYTKAEELTILIKKQNGELEEIELEKDFDEDLGLIFESAVFDRIKPCMNKCIFCFVDQQPKGLRDTLYIKDDDYRLSYLQGTYITMTNLKDEDRERISKLMLGPLYVSVQTTNPELRVKMLRNPNAANIMNDLKWLQKCQIPIHCQIVLCPEYNDDTELERTLSDLSKFKDIILSVAIVPVGLTQFRTKELKPVTKEIAERTIEISSKYKKVCCSDEFFILAEKPIPDTKYYGNFSQLDDGVGSLRYLLDNFYRLKLPKKIKKPLKVIFATSYAAKIAFDEISRELNKIENFETKVTPVKSTYWGNTITVAGLITSQDLINTIKGEETDYAVISSIMLKAFTHTFLDGRTVEDVEKETGKKLFIINDNYSIKELIDFLKENH